jgi:hypothetical protein
LSNKNFAPSASPAAAKKPTPPSIGIQGGGQQGGELADPGGALTCASMLLQINNITIMVMYLKICFVICGRIQFKNYGVKIKK